MTLERFGVRQFDMGGYAIVDEDDLRALEAGAERIVPRAYRNDWIGTHHPLVTRYGTLTIQPLGWGIRVETRYVYGPIPPGEWTRDSDVDPPLVIYGRECRLGATDYHVDEEGRIEDCKGVIGGDLTEKARAKLLPELFPLVRAWLVEHAAEFAATRDAYVSNQARTCEESIVQLEEAVSEYRRRLALIKAGDIHVSPYVKGGRRLEL